MRHPWVALDVFMFSPFPLVSWLVGHVREWSHFRDVSGHYPLAREGVVRRHSSSADTTTSHSALVIRLASAVSLLLFCQGINELILPAGKISSGPSESRTFREGLLACCLGVSNPPPHAFSSRSGKSSMVCVREGALLQSTPLFQ